MTLPHPQARKENKEDMKRATELAAYSTHQNLQPQHLALVLQVAMKQAFKLKNFITAASFARRLLELIERQEGSSMHKTATKVLRASERQARNAVQLDYDERNPFVVCAKSMTPIYKGSKFMRCPYCFAAFLPDFKGSTCSVCCLSTIGEETLGLLCHAERRSRK